jgi:hypothetical protein
VHSVWLALADTMVGIHYAFMVYLVVGGFIAWRWRKTIILHALAAIWAILIITTKVPCPLTALQNQFRERAGQPPLTSSFINLYVRGTLYPSQEQTLARILLAVVILVSCVGFLRLRRTRIEAGRTPHLTAQRAWSARTVSMVSASSGRLSSRYRTTRAKRSATPPG